MFNEAFWEKPLFSDLTAVPHPVFSPAQTAVYTSCILTTIPKLPPMPCLTATRDGSLQFYFHSGKSKCPDYKVLIGHPWIAWSTLKRGS